MTKHDKEKAMHEKGLVTIYGGTGFVGRYIIRNLLKEGYCVRVACRRPDLAQHLQPMGSVGQIHAMQANLRYKESIKAALQGASYVINTAGILTPKGKQSYKAVIEEGAKNIAVAAQEMGIKRMIHISAIGADGESNSAYQRAKYEAEQHILSLLPESSILRPSLIFGAEDQFFNRFALMAKFSPILPLFKADTKFQPIYVDDVAKAVISVMENEASSSKIYEIGGAETLTFKQLMEMMVSIIHRKKLVLSMPDAFASFLIPLLSLMPSPFTLTQDQYNALAKDNIVSDAAQQDKRDLASLGIEATLMASILPHYLIRFRPQGEFSTLPETSL